MRFVVAAMTGAAVMEVTEKTVQWSCYRPQDTARRQRKLRVRRPRNRRQYSQHDDGKNEHLSAHGQSPLGSRFFRWRESNLAPAA